MKKSLFVFLFLGILQLSAYTQPNVALNKPTTSSFFDGPGLESSKANDADGTNNSFWSATPIPQWWKVDLQGIYDLSSIVIRNYFETTPPRYYHYNIEASTDDVTYTKIAEKTNDDFATDAGDTYVLTNSARYLRVNVVFNSDNPGAHISDFRAYGTPSTTNTITASVTGSGTISPEGAVLVKQGTSQTFTITPNTNFRITDVLVDGVSVGAVPSYTFNNVTIDHTIAATISPIPTYTISAIANTGGTIDPTGDQIVLEGTSNLTYNIASKSGFQIGDVIVDNVSKGAITTFTFNNVTSNHSIVATFIVTSHLALNRPTSSKDHFNEFVSSLANDIDGSNESYWAGLSYVAPSSWWKVDLGGVFNIDKIVIRNFVDGVRFYHYNIEASNDDATYSQIVDKSNDNIAVDDGDSYNLTTSARYLRVNMTFNSDNPGVHISDFRVYGSAPLTITGVTVSDKDYDGTTTATLVTTAATLVGAVSGDAVSLVSTGATGTFDNKIVGTGKTVVTTGFALAGADAFKYTLVQPTVSGTIKSKSLTITGITADNKIYNGNTTATLSGTPALSGVVSPDVVTPAGTPVADFASKNIGTGIAVTVTGLTLSGADAGNYTVTAPAGLVANITAKELTIAGITADNKVFDGNTTATLSGTPVLTGVVLPDVVTLGGTPVATFASAAVGDNIPVTVTGYTISGADNGNYSLTQPAGLTANITLSTGVEQLQSGKLSYSVYPNPATDFATLTIANYNNEKLSYILFDARGNMLENKQITSSKSIIELQNLSSGTYFIKINDNNKDIKTIKIIKN